ncbi:MAG: phosphatidylinositol mannoside acyltransferase [Acidimicrobiia bacterium]
MSRSERRTYRGYTRAARIVCALPERVAYPLAALAGRALYYVMGSRRAMAARHQYRITGATGVTLRRRTRQVFRSYARYWCEFFRLPRDAGDRELLNARFIVDGFENIENGVAAGNGVILALPHVGGWEFAGAWLANQGYPPVVVAERVRPAELFDFFKRQREALGMEVIALGSGAGTAVVDALRNNRVVCLLCDRDIARDGVAVEFFGEITTMPAGPAAMAIRTGAALLPVAVYFDGAYGHYARIGAPLQIDRSNKVRDEVPRVMQTLAESFEALIRRAPGEWHVLQPNWPSDRVNHGDPVPSARG